MLSSLLEQTGSVQSGPSLLFWPYLQPLEYLLFQCLSMCCSSPQDDVCPNHPLPLAHAKGQAYPGELLLTPQIPGQNAPLLSGAPSQVVTFATVSFHTSPNLELICYCVCLTLLVYKLFFFNSNFMEI